GTDPRRRPDGPIIGARQDRPRRAVRGPRPLLVARLPTASCDGPGRRNRLWFCPGVLPGLADPRTHVQRGGRPLRRTRHGDRHARRRQVPAGAAGRRVTPADRPGLLLQSAAADRRCFSTRVDDGSLMMKPLAFLLGTLVAVIAAAIVAAAP